MISGHALVISGHALTGSRLESPLQVKAVNAEHALDRHLGLLAPLDGRKLVDAHQAALDAHQILLAHKVDLVEEQPVGERHLRDRLIHHAIWLDLVQVLLNVFGVHECDDSVEARKGLNVLVHQKGLRHRCWVCHSCELDDDGIEAEVASFGALGELLDKVDQV